MKKIVTSLLLIVFMLTGCTIQNDAGEEASASVIASGEKVPVAAWESSGTQLQSDAKLVGETLFFMKGEWDKESGWYNNAFIYKKDKGADEAAKIVDLGEEKLVIYLADEAESVYCLTSAEKDGRTVFNLRKTDKEGVSIYQVPVESPDDEKSQEALLRLGTVTMGQVNSNGEVCLSGEYGDIYLFDQKGQLLHRSNAPWNDKSYNSGRCGLVNAGKEGIFTYLIENREISLREIDFSAGKLLTEESIQLDEISTTPMNLNEKNLDKMPLILEIHNGYNMGILLSDSDFLWKYEISGGKLEKVLGWGDSTVNLKGYFIDAIGIKKDKSLYVMAHQFYEDVSFISIANQDIAEIPEEQTVTIGMIESYGVIRSVVEKMVSNFNRMKTGFKIEVQYYDSITDFYLKLIKGEGTDILSLYDMDIIVLEDKGVLENLSPYFAESDKVKESDLLPSIQRAGTIGGNLVCVLPTFQVNGFWVEKGATKKGGWTPDEYIAMGEKNPEVPLRERNPQYYHNDILKTVIQADMNSYVDWEKKVCFFNTENFIDLVKRVKELNPSNIMDFYDSDAGRERFYQKEVLTSEVSINSIYGNNEIDRNEGIVNGKYFEIAGFPSQSGEPSYELLSLSAFGINSTSENKDGAWAFLEFLLSEEYQNRLSSFPVRQDAFERHIAMKAYRSTDVNMSQEDRDFIRYMVDHAYWSEGSRAVDISVMIYEELSPVWLDAKTAEEAAEILQNRVTIYLKE